MPVERDYRGVGHEAKGTLALGLEESVWLDYQALRLEKMHELNRLKVPRKWLETSLPRDPRKRMGEGLHDSRAVMPEAWQESHAESSELGQESNKGYACWEQEQI